MAGSRFAPGTVVRYGDRVSALFRVESAIPSGDTFRYYGTHVLGGSHSAMDVIFVTLREASDDDWKFIHEHQPGWQRP